MKLTVVLSIAFALFALAQGASPVRPIACDSKRMVKDYEYANMIISDGVFIDVWDEMDCCELCEKKAGCRYWTFESVADDFPYGICALKSGYGGLIKNTNAVSGRMRVGPTPGLTDEK